MARHADPASHRRTEGEGSLFSPGALRKPDRRQSLHLPGESFTLQPNTDEPLVLHGDGWLDTWNLTEKTGNSLELDLVREQPSHSPYAFKAHQKVHLDEDCLSLSLRVTNLGKRPCRSASGFIRFSGELRT